MQNLDEVHIKLPSDTWRIIYVSLQNTVLECKHVIEKSYGVPYEVQRLFYDNVILPDSKILCNCGIQPGDTIEVWEPGEIEILHISGFSFRTWVEPSFTIDTLRHIIEEDRGYHYDDVRLIFNGRDVWDYERQLAGWGMRTGARVHMVTRFKKKLPCNCKKCGFVESNSK